MANTNKIWSTPNDSGIISFDHINYVVKSKSEVMKQHSKWPTLPLFNYQRGKQVLFDVSGRFVHGMNGILGPSGCGKSSLLDVLANRKDSKDVEGSVFINGLPRDLSSRSAVGYVVQEDLCSGALTVRENLIFSLSLRSPDKLSMDEKQSRVSAIITELGLDACAETRVGTEFIRGISGGEKKRVCIGLELVLSPTILLLDEPTTGLDAATAGSIMNCLKDLSERGRTIVFSIHQPRYSIFKLFDTVMLMCKGRCVYHGLGTGVLPFFSTYGYQCEPNDNPADFALDVLIDMTLKPNTMTQLNDLYKATYENALATQRLHGGSTGDQHFDEKRQNSQYKRCCSPGTEIFYLSQRTLRNSVRNPALPIAQLGVSIVLGSIIGLLFFDLKKTTEPGVDNRLGAIFFIIITQIFLNVTALDALLKERVLFVHEYASGYYRIFTFFVAKLLCDLLPMRVVPTILFSSISYFMMGFNRATSQFFIFLLTIFMTSLFGSAICFFVSASVSVFPVALILVILICVVIVLFGGFLLDLASVFNWLSWLQWVSACRYASNLLIINEFSGLTFCLPNNTNVCPMAGEQILDRLEISHSGSWDLWKNFVALTIMTLLFFLFAYVQLIRMKKTK